jgi:hypothetical protein
MYSYLSNRLWWPTGLWYIEAPIFFLDNQLTDGSEIVSIKFQPHFTPRKIPGTNFC